VAFRSGSPIPILFFTDSKNADIEDLLKLVGTVNEIVFDVGCCFICGVVWDDTGDGVCIVEGRDGRVDTDDALLVAQPHA